MKEENVLKFLAVGIYLGGTNRDFQMEQYIHKGKRDGIYRINLRRTWRNFCCQLVPWLPLKTQLMSRPCLSGILVSELCWSLPLPRGLLLLMAASLPEPSVTRSRQLSENRDFWWLLIPELTTSLSQRCLVTILCNKDSPLCSVVTATSATEKEPTQLVPCCDVGLGVSTHAPWHRLTWPPLRRSAWSLLPQKTRGDGKGRVDRCWKAARKEEFQARRTAPAFKFTALQPEVADGPEGVLVPCASVQQFPTEAWSAALMGKNFHWGVLSCSSVDSLTENGDKDWRKINSLLQKNPTKTIRPL